MRNLHRTQHICPADELCQQASLHVPGDMAVEGPQSGIVSYKANERPPIRLDRQRIPAQSIDNSVAFGFRRPDGTVVISPVK